MKQLPVYLLTILLLFSCKSLDQTNTGNTSTAPLFGMVYDSESNPVSGAEVVIDKDQQAHTDINGRVLFSNVVMGKHEVIIRKEGYETTSIELDFFNRDQVLYTTLISIRNIVEQLETALEEKKLVKAAGLIERAETIQAENIRLRYLMIVFFTKARRYTEALEEIRSLRQVYPDDPNLIITQASILFHGLGQNDKARSLLSDFLELESNEDMTLLLDEIKLELNNNELEGDPNGQVEKDNRR